MKNLVIVGVGGFARETYVNALSSVGHNSEYAIKGFLDGTIKMPVEEYEKLPLPVLGSVDNYLPNENDIFIVAVGDSKIRAKLIDLLNMKKVNYATIVNKAAVIAPTASLGEGVIVAGGCYIGPDTKVGNNVLINIGTVTGHDVVIDDYVSIMPKVALSARVKVGKYALIGCGVSVYPGIVIGDYATVGIGSVVIGNVRSGSTVFGNPARRISK